MKRFTYTANPIGARTMCWHSATESAPQRGRAGDPPAAKPYCAGRCSNLPRARCCGPRCRGLACFERRQAESRSKSRRRARVVRRVAGMNARATI